MKPRYSLNQSVIASPADSPEAEFIATVIDYIEESGLYIVRDQDDDVWQCAEAQLEESED